MNENLPNERGQKVKLSARIDDEEKEITIGAFRLV